MKAHLDDKDRAVFELTVPEALSLIGNLASAVRSFTEFGQKKPIELNPVADGKERLTMLFHIVKKETK